MISPVFLSVAKLWEPQNKAKYVLGWRNLLEVLQECYQVIELLLCVTDISQVFYLVLTGSPWGRHFSLFNKMDTFWYRKMNLLQVTKLKLLPRGWVVSPPPLLYVMLLCRESVGPSHSNENGDLFGLQWKNSWDEEVSTSRTPDHHLGAISQLRESWRQERR